jgi:hypothetical protein
VPRREGDLQYCRLCPAKRAAPSECAHHVFGITRSGDFTATPSNDDTRFAHCPNCGIAAPSEGENEPAEPRDMTNVTGLTDRERYGLDQLDAPGGPRPNKQP